MTTTAPPPARSLAPLPRPDRWHRPLLALAVLMAALVVVAAVLAVADPEPVTGQDKWFKPMKFAVSITLYAVTLAWLIGQVRRFQRAVWVAGTISAVALLVEMVIIVGAAAAGTTSHFNVTTPLHATLWSVMGASIVVVWVITALVGLALIREPGPDPARNLAIRAGIGLAVVGMGVAFFMTVPTAAQLADFQGISGAHAVGAPDDGPGLPFLGWSTAGGDLRVPHFIGMHGLQAIPLFLLLLERSTGRFRRLGEPGVRVGLVAVAALGYAALTVLLTVQALLGQPLLRPGGAIVAAGVVALAAVALAGARVLLSPGRSPERVEGPR